MAGDLAIVGYPFLPIGMGEHARSTFRAFRAAGTTPALLDVADHRGEVDPDLDRDFSPYLATGAAASRPPASMRTWPSRRPAARRRARPAR